MTQNDEPWLLYDGHCPFCSNYVKLVRLRQAVGHVRLIDARGDTPEKEEAAAAGLDLNEGMVLKYGGQLYHGDECIHILSVLSTNSGLFNKVNSWVFRSETRAKLLYPLLRAGRNTTLRVLGVERL